MQTPNVATVLGHVILLGFESKRDIWLVNSCVYAFFIQSDCRARADQIVDLFPGATSRKITLPLDPILHMPVDQSLVEAHFDFVLPL